MIFELLARRQGAQVPRPSNLNASPASVASISVTWTNANGTLQTELWRNGSLFATIAAGTASYTDGAVAAGVEYTYQVRHKASATSFSSFTAAVVESAVPPAPGLNGAVVVEDDVQLSWNTIASATEYRVLRASVSGGPYTQIGTTSATTYTDLERPNGTWYYIVRAYNGLAESGNSNQVSAVVSFAPPISPPTGFDAVATHCDRATLEWANGSGTAQIEVYRGTSPDPTELIATLAAGTTTYADENIPRASFDSPTTIYYRIRHISGASISSYVSDSVVLGVPELTGVSLSANTTTEEVTLTYSITNPPFQPRIDVGDWSDTDRVVDVAARTDVGASPVLIATYGDIVPIPTGTSVTGTLTYVRLRSAAGLAPLLDELTNLVVDFDYVGGA